MTEEEVEVVAEELAKIGGISWHPSWEQGPLMRVVTDRYRAEARVVIATLDRIRNVSEPICTQDLGCNGPQEITPEFSVDQIRPGVTVVYRPLGDRRAYPCRIVEIQGDRAYLAPILRTCVGWVSLERLQSAADETVPLAALPAVEMYAASFSTSSDGKNDSIIRVHPFGASATTECIETSAKE